MQLFNVIELLLFTINEYRELSGEVIRIDLTQTAALVMHFMRQLT